MALISNNDFYIELSSDNDADEIAGVYNSNKHFLINHIDRESVTNKWVKDELKSMKDVGFYSCKIVEASSGKIIGIADFKIDVETYLSLLMIHGSYKAIGLGRRVFNEIEGFSLSHKSKSMRIDVVVNYDSNVLDFWAKNGFFKFQDIALNWTGKLLPAVVMRKVLSE